MEVNEHWKELRPQIGAFVNELEGLYKGAENLDEALTKAEARGFQKGFSEDKQNICNSCYQKEFFFNCNGNIDLIEKFLKLSNSSKLSIKTMILQLYHLEKDLEKEE